MNFNERLKALREEYYYLLDRPNVMEVLGNGIFHRYKYPALTADHTPLFWRYDLNEATNPRLLTRFGINSVFNAGAIRWNGKYLIMARVEGWDRKSFFAIAESPNGYDHFTFRDTPVSIPPLGDDETNIYDMRLVEHEDGWVYGIFCTESLDQGRRPSFDAVAQCGIVRTKDFDSWERLPNIKTNSPQQRNIVLHPELVNGEYAFYTRPQDSFIKTGRGGGIGIGFCRDIQNPVIKQEDVIFPREYHTVYEEKNGLGPAPIKTDKGWLHLAHGVRSTASGLRYVLYLFMTDLMDISKIIYKPAGYFMAPMGKERVGDVFNVLFSNGWIENEDGKIFIYYASSDTRLHVASSSVDRLIDYCIHTHPDGYNSFSSVESLMHIIKDNQPFIPGLKDGITESLNSKI